jgi:hypothetical protein
LNHAEGWRRMAIVFVGAAIGGFVVWPLIRPAFVGDPPPVYSGPAMGSGNHAGIVPYGYPVPPDGAVPHRLRLPETVGDGSAVIGQPRRYRRCSHDGQHITCGRRQDRPVYDDGRR